MNVYICCYYEKKKLKKNSHFSTIPKIFRTRSDRNLYLTSVGTGVIDAFVHIIEQFLAYPVNGLLQDFMAESILKTLIIEGAKALIAPPKL
jgi:alcohol dehydrogenase YqhD (iron-dependent ADH family)